MKKINIKFVSIGARVQTVELPENSLVSDLKDRLSITRRDGSFYRKGSGLNPRTALKDRDIIIYAFSIRGEATVRRNGKVWQVNKNDLDPFPSDFHAHNYADNETLDLYTGFLYKSHTKNKIAMLLEKDYEGVLINLSKRKEMVFRDKANKILKENFPLKLFQSSNKTDSL